MAELSFENMNPDVTPYMWSLDVNVLLKNKNKKRYNNHLI